jgi:hypothetical protein
MEFWLSGSLFSRTFSFSRWNSGYQGAFRTNFSFLTMEFWLSRSLSHELFSFFMMEFCYQGAFHTKFFFFFHDGILAIKEPFTRTFLFSRWNSQNSRFGGRLFSYIYIYITKSIYIGSSFKTLPLDLEPPLQGKEYGPPYSNTTKRMKAIVFSEITYRHVIRLFNFLECKLAKNEKVL